MGISSQGGTFVLLNKGLKPLAPAVTWLDNRAAAISKSLASGKSADYFYKKTGHFLSGWAPPSVCRWFWEKEPLMSKKVCRISFVADYLNNKLTDRFFIDPTSAQMSCLYNIGEGVWDKEILKMSCVGEKSLPVVLPSNFAGGAISRKAAGLLNLMPGTPVVAGAHDQYCASLGAGASKPGDCLLSCGTAWVLLITTDNLVFLPAKGWMPGRHVQGGRFGLMSSIGNAGAVLDWVRSNIKIKRTEGEIKTDVEVIPDFSLKKGEIKNIGLSTRGEEIYYAAMKALVLKVKKRIGEVEGKKAVNRLFMVGGATKEKVLPGMIERITGRELIMPEIAEAAGRGAAMLALDGKTACI